MKKEVKEKNLEKVNGGFGKRKLDEMGYCSDCKKWTHLVVEICGERWCSTCYKMNKAFNSEFR